MKLLLIHANSPMDTLIPPNLSTMAAYLKRNGIEVHLFDTTFYKTREKTGDEIRAETLQVKETKFSTLGINYNRVPMESAFIKKIHKFRPNLVGLSAVSLTYPLGLKLLKALPYKILTIVGGTHATVNPEEVIANPLVDILCVGEGEKALLKLCKCIESGEDYLYIDNLWVKRNGQIQKNPVGPPIDINSLPFQDWEIFDKRRYYKPMGGKIRITGGLELSRGCPYNCNFCSNFFFHKMYGKEWCREKDISHFIAEVKHLRDKHDMSFIYMCCETFLATSNERFNEFIEKYNEFKIPFWMETRPESVTDEKIKRLKGVGLESMNIGIEHGNEQFRKEVLNRHMSNQQIINAVRIAKKYKVRIGTNNIIGFPDETRELVFETIELNRQADPDSVMIHPFNPYHGTKLYDLCLEKGYITKETCGGDYRIDYPLKQPSLSRDELMGLYRTFALYTKFPKERWPEIKKAEKDDKAFKVLSKEYKEKYLRGSR